MRQLVPAAEQLSPTLVAFGKLAPESKAFFNGLAPVIGRAPTGFAAARRLFRDDFPPLLRALDPFLRNLNPLFKGLNLYKQNVTSFFANIAAATNVALTLEINGQHPQFLRVLTTFNPESISTFPNRLAMNRASAYSPPDWALGVTSGLPSFETRQCSSGLVAAPDPKSAESTAFQESIPHNKSKDAKAEAEDFFKRMLKYAFREQASTSTVPAPPCNQQAQLKSITAAGELSTYQHTFEQSGK